MWQSGLTLIMSELEICPVCKQGHLYPEGRAGVDREAKGDFRETSLCEIYYVTIADISKRMPDLKNMVGQRLK
jgi:hypothetical protein